MSSAARRSLLTTTAAASVLGALWFVPSANATADRYEKDPSTPAKPSTETRLAETGSVDTTPYVVGGLLFLGAGAGFVAYSARRSSPSGV